MQRFYLPPEQCQHTSLLLTQGEAHHALHVVRVQRGERVTVLDGKGGQLLCEVLTCERDKVRLGVVQRQSQPAPLSQVTLLQAIPKGKIMDAIVQKATELGASRIVPLFTERVVGHFDREEAVHKGEKWRQTAREAVKQCGSAWLPEVETPLALSEFLARGEKFELPLIASLETDSRPAREYFRRFQEHHARLPHSISVWIGPEGDFTPAETKAIESQGALPITLGRLVLRTDTAAIYCLSVINHELQSKSR
jgi:16S rRNA (uracil1498-N3)-methyltransferase